MNLLVKEIIKNLLPEQGKKQITALYAGGFKPPTAGHFAVVKEALRQNPEIEEFIIFVGSKERDGVSQDESLLIWEVYNKYLPFKVKIEPSSAPPVKAVYNFAKNHPTREILWVLGAREDNEEDFKDIGLRTKSITNYPNIEVRTIITKGGVSGTAARNAAKVSFEKFESFIPSILTPEEKREVYQLVSGKIQETLNEISLPKAIQQISRLNPNADVEQVAKDFIRLTPNLDKKDLFQYKTYNELEQAIGAASETKTQKRKQAKSMDLEDNEFIFYKDDNFTVYKLDNPTQHPESCEIAQGAKICVASNSKKYWDQYMIDGDGVLFYIRNKKYDIPHPKSVIAFMFPRKGLKIGYTEIVDYNDEDLTMLGDYKDQKLYLNSIGLPSSVVEKMFKFVPKSEPLQYYILNYKGKKSILKTKTNTYKFYNPQVPPAMGNVTVFEDENGEIIGTLKGYIYKISPFQQKWLKFRFPDLPQSQIYQIDKINQYFKENSKEVTLYSIDNNKLVKTGNAHFPYGEKEINILMSGGELEIPKKFLNENVKYIEYIIPNFKIEWEEALRYPEFEEMGMDSWIRVAKQGKSTQYSQIKNILGNVDLDFDSLEEPKKQRFVSAFERGTIEMPIAVKFSDEDYDLVAGNTRLAGLVNNEIDPKIWIVDISNQRLNLGENIYTLDIPKFNYKRTLTENLWNTINEISLSKDNAVEINGDLTGGNFKVGDIIYTYSIKNISNPYKDLGVFYNIQFTPEENVTSISQGGKENYIKILSTMFKIVSNFAEKEKPEYIGIASMDNDRSKNYHKVYANLTDNRFNNLPEYSRKDVSLEFNTPEGKGKFVVLKRKSELNENASYSNHIDYKQKIKALTKHMMDKGMNISPLPKVIFKHGDAENAKQFLGKTAYYNPETMEIVLYTEGRHPKDIVRSFSHEMIHHIQNLENRLGNIATTNTQEDDNLNDIEAEANLKGTMTFRNWTDSLQEAIVGDKVVCDGCGWSWDIKDGGKDVYLCHKCGHDNTPKPTKESLLEEEDKLMAEVVNPDGDRFEYTPQMEGLYTYKDSRDNLYFARILYQSTPTPYFEFKVGWFEDNDISKPKYDPQLPPNSTAMDNLKRRNTIAKIYRDEIIPYFKEKLSLSNTLIINPISDLRYTFSKRLVQNYTPKDFDIQYDDENQKSIQIVFKQIEEKKSKDPFGLNAYAMELARLREEETEYTIYCDMDSVLVDFDRGYQELTGMTTQQADANGVETFWEPLTKAGAKFWITLDWMPDGKQLWNYIKPYNPILLSAPSREESSKLGKRVWVKRELPGVKLILKYAPQKQEYASPTSILIDDRQKNIDQWEAAGGIGILHTNASDTIEQLKKLGI